MFKYVSQNSKGIEGKRSFTPKQAKHIWETLAFLKFKVPHIDLKDTLSHVEKWLQEDDINREIFNEVKITPESRLRTERKLSVNKKRKTVIDPVLKPKKEMQRTFKKTIIVLKKGEL
jgi:hypothetical protein